MTISVSCDSCGKSYTVGDDKAGRRFSCKDCGARVTVPDLEPEDVWDGNDYEEYDDGGSDYDAYDSDGYDQDDDAHGNPYAAPVSRTGTRRKSRRSSQPLASRLTRLGAYLLDGVVAFPAAIPLIIGVVMVDPEINQGNPNPLGPVFIGVGMLLILILLGVQLYLLGKNGQTIGKKICKCRIVDYNDGTHPGFGRIFAMRMLLPGVIRMIPCVGSIFGLVDPLMIFGEEQRCLHDLLANTKVVEV